MRPAGARIREGLRVHTSDHTSDLAWAICDAWTAHQCGTGRPTPATVCTSTLAATAGWSSSKPPHVLAQAAGAVNCCPVACTSVRPPSFCRGILTLALALRPAGLRLDRVRLARRPLEHHGGGRGTRLDRLQRAVDAEQQESEQEALSVVVMEPTGAAAEHSLPIMGRHGVTVAGSYPPCGLQGGSEVALRSRASRLPCTAPSPPHARCRHRMRIHWSR